VVDMSGAHIWDASSVAALDAITTKYAARGKQVEILGLNEASASFHENLAGKLGAGH
jgi:SulP family sulfate permease